MSITNFMAVLDKMRDSGKFSKSTVKNRGCYIRKFDDFNGQQVAVETITATQLESFREWCRREGYTASNCQNAVDAVAAVARYFDDSLLPDRSPFTYARTTCIPDTSDIANWELERVVNEFMAPSGRFADQTIMHRRTHVRSFARFVGRMPTAEDVVFESIKNWYRDKIERGGSIRAAQSAMSHLVSVIRFVDPTRFPEFKNGGDKTQGRGCPQKPCCDQSHGLATPHTDLTHWALPCIVQCAMEPKQKYSIKTLKRYRAVVRNFQLYLRRSVTPSDVTAALLDEYVRWRVEKGASPKTAAGARLILAAVVRFAKRDLLPGSRQGGGNSLSRRTHGRFRKNFADAATEGTLEWYLIEQYFPSKTKIASLATERFYGMVVGRFSHYLGRPAVLTDLDDLTIGKWVRSMRQEKPPLAAATINGCIEKIRALWNWLAKKRFVEQFPTIENVPAPQRIPRCWLEHEMVAIYQAACRMPGYVGQVPADKWWPAFVLTAWDTGERTSAMLSLRWNDFDPTGGTLEAPAEIRKGGRKPMLYRLKLETIRAFEEIRYPKRAQIFHWSSAGDIGKFYQQYKSLILLADLPYEKHKSGPQKIRRAFASYIEANGGNATDALAHTMRRVTMDSYLDLRVTQRKSPNDVLFNLTGNMTRSQIANPKPLLLSYSG